jgi:hypothetical protein
MNNNCCPPVLTPRPSEAVPCKSSYSDLLEAKRLADEARKAKEYEKFCCSKREGIYTTNKTRDASELTMDAGMKAAASFVGTQTKATPDFSLGVLRAGGNALGCCTRKGFPMQNSSCCESSKPKQFS